VNTKSKIYLTLSILFLLGAGIFYLNFSKLFIGADELMPNKIQTCRVDIAGNLKLTHLEKDSNLKLLLTSGSKTLSETVPAQGKYHFVIENIKPSGSWDIVARESLGGQTLQYPVSSVSGLECDSNNNLDLQF
jgi:hypothetical protein